MTESAQIDYTDPPGESYAELFGHSAALDGDRALIGAPYDEGQGLDLPGFAEIHERSAGGWNLVIQLASGGSADDGFGEAVALTGDLAVVGSARFDIDQQTTNAGRVYVFNRTTGGPDAWGQVATIEHPTPANEDRFGSNLGLSIDDVTGEILLAVGVPRDDLGGTDYGSVQVYRASTSDILTWTHVAELSVPTASVDDRFGNAVAISGDRIVVGAFFADAVAADSGAAYVFERSGSMQNDWSSNVTQLDTPTPAGSAAASQFGTAVAIDGDRVAIGEPGYDSSKPCGGSGEGNPTDQGKVVLFHASGGAWPIEAEIEPLECVQNAGFGSALDLDDDRIVVGAPGADSRSVPGAANVFVQVSGVWTERARLIVDDPQDEERTGRSVAIDLSQTTGDWHYLVGADGHQSFQNPLNNGAGYVFDLASSDCDGDGFADCAQLAACTASDCNANGIIDSCDILSGTSQDCNGDGLPDECSDDCDGDGVSDVVEICGDQEADCNANGIPDACELAPVFDVIFIVDASGSIDLAERDLQIDGIRAAFCIDPAPAPFIDPDHLRVTVIQFPGSNGTSHDVVLGPVVAPFDPDATICTPLEQVAPPMDGVGSSALGSLIAAKALFESNPNVLQRRVILLSDGSVDSLGGHVAAAQELRALSPPAEVCTIGISVTPGGQPELNLRDIANADGDGSCAVMGHSVLAETVADVHAGIRACVVQAMYDCDGDGTLNGCGVDPTADCNCNGISDCVEIAMDPLLDGNGNSVIDACEMDCPADVTGDYAVSFDDLLAVLASWGPCSGCAGDTNDDGAVDFNDLLNVLSGWGWCMTSCPGVAAPQSIADCLQQVGYDAELLEKCVEAMLLNGTP